jgi:hypothetical protein
MRKIRLTESELISFIKQVIKESRYSHDFQSYEDAILDKISNEGIETLSDIEKYILDSIGKENFDVQPVMLMLAKKIAKKESLTDIEQMFYDDNSVESSEDDVKGYRELEPGVLFDAGDDETPPSDDRDNRFAFADPKGEIPSMTFDVMKIYTTDKYIIFQGTLEVDKTTYYGKIYADLDGKYLGYRFKSENQTTPEEDYEKETIDAFLQIAVQELNSDNEQNNEY